MSRTHASREASRPEGFTLVELMVTVVILAVLAAVAVVSYQVYIRRARVAEASGLLGNIKGQQEAYRAEFGEYCNVNFPFPVSGVGPGRDGLDWDPAAQPPIWKALGFVPDQRRISFQLNALAGPPGAFGGAGTLGLAPGDYDADDHWFVAYAIGDQDEDCGDSSIASAGNAVFWITHETTTVDFLRPTE